MVDLARLLAKNPTASLPKIGVARPPLNDFFSIATHYNPNTLITKNGELLQILKLAPAKNTDITTPDANMRDALRIALYKELPTDDYSITVHSVRRKEQVAIPKRYTNPFTKMVDETWHKLHPLKEHYINEIYVSIIKEGSSDNIKNPALFGRSIFGNMETAARQTQLEIACTELELAVDNIIHTLKPYQAEKLGIYQKNGVQYSSALNMLSKLLHLKDVEIPLDFTSFDTLLAKNTIKFGSDAMEIYTAEHGKRFGTMLSIKEYRELSLDSIEEIGQIQSEFILVETADFIPAKYALRNTLNRQKFLNISKDNLLRRTSGINDMQESQQNSITDFAQHQAVIFIIADDLKELNERINTVLQTFNQMGIVLMREDLRMEDCFWSTQPANFFFHKRLNPINAVRLGGFVQEMGHLPTRVESSQVPTTIFKTRDGIPIFFHLPSGEKNIFSILGGGVKENMLSTHFILSQALHQQSRVLYLDAKGNAEVFINALEGDYYSVSPKQAPFALNPFNITLTDSHRIFLHRWVEGLICGASGLALSGQHDDHIVEAINELYTQPAENRNLSRFRDILVEKDDFLGKRITPWVEGNSHSGLFDHPHDAFPDTSDILGFNISAIAADKHSISSVVFYLLHMATAARDENIPFIVIINEMNLLLANPLFGQYFGYFLESLAKHNISVILASSDDANHHHFTAPSHLKSAEAVLLLHTKPATKDFYEAAGIPNSEIQYSHLLEQGEAMLHYEHYDYRVPLLLHRMQTLKPVFYASAAHINEAHTLIAERGRTLQEWLPAYLELTHNGKT